MKKLILLVGMVASITMLSAQSTKVQSAFSYLRSGRLDKAIENIEPAITNEKTMNDAKTWNYRGRIYVQIFPDTNFRKLAPNSIQIAYDSYQKSITLDKDKEFEDNNRIGLLACADQYFELGVIHYTAKDFANALASFDKTIRIKSTYGVNDTLATFNALLSAEKVKDNKKTKEYCISLIRSNFNQPTIYISLLDVYKDEKDTVKAIKTIENGLKKYPNNFDLNIAQANLYLYIGDAQKSEKALNAAIAKDPNNYMLYFAIGTSYEKMNNFEKAEEAYKKAISIKPDYFDANYNLGALYVNSHISIITKANALSLNDKNYDVLKKQADAELVKAMPYLEKSDELQPNDRVVLSALKDIYVRTNNLEKLKIVNQKLSNLK
ncbi:MAG: tetratricopeptide repeat protein [Bacteroidetes bacterium]|nr:tetratricopeptide repeat protein [Bacteroidota bacterium]